MFGRFLRDGKGVAAIEFAFIAPLLALLLFGCIAFFVVFEDSNQAETATFTVGDIVSRQTTVSSEFLDTVHAMFVKMLPRTQTGVSFRVSSIKMKDRKWAVDWSYPVSPMTALSESAIPTQRLPLISEGDSLILVETNVGYAPMFSFGGLAAGTYANISANRPRFTAAITKTN